MANVDVGFNEELVGLSDPEPTSSSDPVSLVDPFGRR